MCQHNKAGAVASSRHDKVGDIECLAPDPSSGDRPFREGERKRKQGDGDERDKRPQKK